MHKKNNWIPASIPPAQDGLYLTTIGFPTFKCLQICDFKEGIWELDTAGIDYAVLAWQPLPAVYKAGD